MKRKRPRRPRAADDDEDAGDTDDDVTVRVIGADVYFYTDVDKKHVLELFSALDQASTYALAHNLDGSRFTFTATAVVHSAGCPPWGTSRATACQ